MPTTSEYEALQEKWREFSEIEKTEILTAFINLYGEHATWEEWRDFLNDQAKSFVRTQLLG
jgi:hypothetical protein